MLNIDFLFQIFIDQHVFSTKEPDGLTKCVSNSGSNVVATPKEELLIRSSLHMLAQAAILGLLLISCKPTKEKPLPAKVDKEWASDSIRKYFRDSIANRMYNGTLGVGDSLNDFDKFSKYILKNVKAKNISDPFILGFDEDYVDTTRIDKVKKWFRITVNPCFRIPYCLVLEQVNGKSILTLKMTDGYGGYYSGNLNFLSIYYFPDTLYSDFSKKLHGLNFWTIADDKSCGGGLDGESWTFEAIENGRYNIVYRWVPLSCGNRITRELASLGIELRNKADFRRYLKLRTGRTLKEIEEFYPEK